MGWRPDSGTLAKIHSLPSPMTLEHALFFADAVLGGTVRALRRDDGVATFLFGLRHFATVEVSPHGADLFIPRFAAYPPGGMVDISDRLTAQGYVDVTHVFVEGA
jgi:hypothetical protein